jgi:hypothetical protein
MLQTWAAILSRRPSFLSNGEWKTIPWSLRTTEKDLTQHLFDEMLEIPKMLWYSDLYRQSPEGPEKLELRQMALLLANEIKSGLEQWKCKWLDRTNWRRPHEKILSRIDPDLPMLRYQHPDHPTGFFELPALVYPNGAIFAATCNYNAAMLIIYDTCRTLGGLEDRSAQLSVAREICQSMSYFLMYLPSSMMGRIAFAIVAAYDTLPEGAAEREYLKKVFHSCNGGTWRQFEDFVCELSALRRHLNEE